MLVDEWDIANRDLRNRHPNDARTKLERFVLEYGGSNAIAKAVGVHQVTVCAWIGRRARPNIEATSKLLKLAGKKLTLDDVIEGTRPH